VEALAHPVAVVARGRRDEPAQRGQVEQTGDDLGGKIGFSRRRNDAFAQPIDEEEEATLILPMRGEDRQPPEDRRSSRVLPDQEREIGQREPSRRCQVGTPVPGLRGDEQGEDEPAEELAQRAGGCGERTGDRPGLEPAANGEQEEQDREGIVVRRVDELEDDQA